MNNDRWKDYWRQNLRSIVVLLIIWFSISFLPTLLLGLGIDLNAINIAGFPLGYYMGAQGSLIGFVLIIFYYARRMNKLDDQFNISDKTERLTKSEDKVKIRSN
jgi:putative solute:sodium symporter small subunit